jgi:hypothetical protein
MPAPPSPSESEHEINPLFHYIGTLTVHGLFKLCPASPCRTLVWILLLWNCIRTTLPGRKHLNETIGREDADETHWKIGLLGGTFVQPQLPHKQISSVLRLPNSSALLCSPGFRSTYTPAGRRIQQRTMGKIALRGVVCDHDKFTSKSSPGHTRIPRRAFLHR